MTALTAATAAGAVVLVIAMIKFELYIPPEYIPSNNVFDLKFYFDIIKSSMQHDISFYGYIPSEFERSLKNAVAIQGVLVSCAATALLLVISNARLAKSVVNPLHAIADGLPIACCAGTLLAMAVLSAGGLPFVFPLKELAVFAMFIVLYIKSAGAEKAEPAPPLSFLPRFSINGKSGVKTGDTL